MKEKDNEKSKNTFWKKVHILWKPFLILFFLFFVIWNWNNIFWTLNYHVIFEKVISPFVKAKKMLTNEEPQGENYFVREGKIEIPKINIEAPLLFIDQNENNNLSEKDFQEYLKDGVVHYPDSTLPGTEGVSVILGHSAPPGWPKINYDWVFNDINKLEPGDEISVYINDEKQFIYQVARKVFLEKGEEISSLTELTPLETQGAQEIEEETSQEKFLTGLTKSKPVLILISCWPPGKDKQRIGVEAVLID